MTVKGLIALCLLGAVPGIAGAQLLDEQEFRRLHTQLNPGEETWKSIPWRISLLEAQRAAARHGQPIFIWAMDGHPLGCT